MASIFLVLVDEILGDDDFFTPVPKKAFIDKNKAETELSRLRMFHASTDEKTGEKVYGCHLQEVEFIP